MCAACKTSYGMNILSSAATNGRTLSNPLTDTLIVLIVVVVVLLPDCS